MTLQQKPSSRSTMTGLKKACVLPALSALVALLAAGGEATPAGTCPDPDPLDHTVHLADLTDCNAFYRCDHATPKRERCNAGLHFNPVLQICDWPANAGCTLGGGAGDGSQESGEGDGGNGNESNGNEGGDIDINKLCKNATLQFWHIPYPGDCTKFIKCDLIGGEHNWFQCDAPLHFNPKIQTCDWPENSGCVGSGDDSEETKTPAESTTIGNGGSTKTTNTNDRTTSTTTQANTWDPICDQATEEVWHLPVPGDCTKFIKCDILSGISKEYTCDEGLHFNPTIQTCDWPENAGCEDTNPITPSEPSSGEKTTTDNSNSQTTSATDDNNDSGTTSTTQANTWDPICDQATEEVWHLPVPGDCTKFIKCDILSGISKEYTCDEGLHFNPTIQTCDWPENAGCEDTNPITPSEPSSGEKTTTDNSNSQTTSATDDNNDSGTTSTTQANTWDPICDQATEEVWHLPVPGDCTKFIKCDILSGISKEYTCDEGLHFNPTIQTCDWPENAGCEDTNPITPSEPSSGDNTTTDNSNSQTTSATDDNNDSGTTSTTQANTWDPICDQATEEVWHLPVPGDCTKFIKCDILSGISKEYTCIEGLHFNPTIQTCDWPENAGCEDTNPITPSEPSSGEKTTTDNSNSQTTSATDDNNDSGTTSTTQANTWDPICDQATEEVWHLPVPGDCTKFIKCDILNGISKEYTCDEGLHFNPTIQTCDWPENAGCEDTNPITPSEPSSGEKTTTDNSNSQTTSATDDNNDSGTTSTTQANTWDPICDQATEEVWHLPVPGDCTKFIKCDILSGISKEYTCDEGLQFNPTIQTCDWPENAGCEDTNPITPSEPSSGEKTTTDNSNSQTTSATDDNNDSGTTSTTQANTWNPICDQATEEVWHLPVPGDCTKFIKCDILSGISKEYTCDEGLHFNPTIQTCDWPENAGCEDTNPITPSEPSSGEKTTTDNSNSQTTSATDDNNDSGTTSTTQANTWDPICDQATEEVWHLPVPGDCTKFIKCDILSGISKEYTCDEGLHFNPTIQTCDWPENAGCEDTNPITPSEPSSGEKTTTDNSNSQTTSATDDNNDSGTTSTTQANTWDPICDQATEEVWHLPVPGDCTKFIKCDILNGISKEYTCDEGLHFNPTIQTCDWPENAGCEDTNPITPSEPSSGEKTTTDNSNSQTTSATDDNNDSGTTSTTQANTWDPICDQATEEVWHLPVPGDCTKFIKCDILSGISKEYTCDEGLHFNPTIQTCDWPENAGCEDTNPITPSEPSSGEKTTTDNSNSQTTSATDDNNDSGTTSTTQANTWDPICDQATEEVWHLPVPGDCTKFIKCDILSGISKEYTCDEGLHFNPTIQTCDWPENAGCEDTNPITPSEPSSGEKTTTDNSNSQTTSATDDNNDSGTTSTTQANTWDPICDQATEEVWHLPVPGDCTKFIKCDILSGISKEYTCDEGLHFNPTIQTCDWPENAGCEDTNPITPSEPSSGEKTTTDNSNSQTTSATDDNNDSGTTSTTQANTWDPICDQATEEVWHLPVPGDCTKFIKCDIFSGISKEYTCDEGLHFNPTIQTCDWPENAGCEALSTGSGESTPSSSGESTSSEEGSTTSTTTTEEPVSDSKPSDESSSSSSSSSEECDCDESDDAEIGKQVCKNATAHRYHLPHPTDPTKFFKCELTTGIAHLFQCPSYQVFNAELQVCV